MEKPNGNQADTREAWLRTATNMLRPMFEFAELPLPDRIRFAIAFPSSVVNLPVPAVSLSPISHSSPPSTSFLASNSFFASSFPIFGPSSKSSLVSQRCRPALRLMLMTCPHRAHIKPLQA